MKEGEWLCECDDDDDEDERGTHKKRHTMRESLSP